MPRAPPPSSCECEIASTRISIRRHVIEHASAICTIGDERDSSPSDEMKKFWLVLLLPLLLLLWWGVGRGQSRPTLHFDQVSRATIESTVSTNGKVEPAQWAAARAETAGTVRTVSVQRGQTVSEGQPLAMLDTAGAESELAAASARQQEAQAEATTLGQGGRAGTVAEIE